MALASIIAVLIVAIVIVVIVSVRRKQSAKKGEVVITKDSRSTLENPIYLSPGQQQFTYYLPTTQNNPSL